ncbi:MAG TPA: hypothetical protein VNW92_00330 [Polyangiaceae bacterium]|jgi:hypothetical protein|nr:hypothetical protein [Polyangiaceae bacterium]
MNGKRTYWQLLLASAGVGLLITNCTIQSATDSGSTANGGAGNASSGSCTAGTRVNGCICLSDNHVSSQLCGSNGLYGACDCSTSSSGGTSAGGTSSTGGTSAGGTSSTAGTNSTGGATGGYAGTGGYSGGSTAGSGGASACASGISTADDCIDCLNKACATQWAACAAEDEAHPDSVTGDYCLQNSPQADPGQMDSILDCIATERGKLMAAGQTVVKRDVVRACGASIGLSSDPNNNFIWAPQEMTKATKDLMNCMADSGTAAMPGAWADSNDPASFAQDPDGGLPSPLPWADCTCAKTSCTSPL